MMKKSDETSVSTSLPTESADNYDIHSQGKFFILIFNQATDTAIEFFIYIIVFNVIIISNKN